MATATGGLLALAGSACLGIAYVYAGEIKLAVAWSCSKIRGQFVRRIIIDVEKNPRIAYAINEALKDKFMRDKEHLHRVLIVTDGQNEMEFELEKGWYEYESGVYIKLDSEQIEIMCYRWKTTEKIIKCQSDIYIKYTSGESAKIVFFFPKGNDWHPNPVFRDVRKFGTNCLTEKMKAVIQDLQENFLNCRNKYEQNNWPYRYGIIIGGPPGTGKSQIIEWIASELKRPVFLPSLNSNDMCDADLIRMISQVPKNSCIGLEELDHQLTTMKKNVNNTVSIAGLLTAIDGPQRLNDGVIVVATTNNVGFLEEHNIRDSFVRAGRFDQIWEF